MKNRNVYRAVILTILLILMFSGESAAQFKFRIKPYFGAGIKYALKLNPPDYVMTDALDSTYYDLHLESPRQYYFHFHGRMMALEAWDFSLGYMLWIHSFKYSDDLTELWLQTTRIYPHSYYFTMHCAVLQYTFNHPSVSTQYMKPFIVAGIGKFHGATKNVYYLATQYSNVLEKKTEADEEFSGWGYYFSAGIELFKYAFIAVEYMDLNKRSLVASQFIQVSIGITI